MGRASALPFFMFEHPFFGLSRQQALSYLSDQSRDFSIVQKVLLLIRAKLFAEAESQLLILDSTDEQHSLLLLLRVAQGFTDCLEGLINDDLFLSKCDVHSIFFARQNLLVLKGEYEAVARLGLPKFDNSDSTHWHKLILADAYLWLGRVSEAEILHSQFNDKFNPPERLELAARLALLKGDFLKSLDLLSPLLDAGDASVFAWELAIHALNHIGESSAASTMLHRAKTLFPYNSRIMARQVLYSLTNRQPILGRSFALLERLYRPPAWNVLDRQRSHQNLAFSYENGGRVDLLTSLHPWMIDDGLTWEIVGNRALQLASLASPQAPNTLTSAQKLLPRAVSPLSPIKPNKVKSRLRIGFITPDVCYHPVARFLLMQMRHRSLHDHEYYLVSIANRRDWATDLAVEMMQATDSWCDLSESSDEQRIHSLREMELDVAVDLAGWTGHALPALFASKIAPVQVNYLGFFASTGLPEMNYWLGDKVLFPENTNEWSTEKLWRLNRCFIAWEPFDQLPEGRVVVPAGPSGPDVVFGSFNHVRKLGDPTLRLWARILEAVPHSRIALKSYTSDDPGTTTLLRRRMLRCGLNPERVVWLPTTPAPEDHLQQYSLIDVALDPFPNGGCTTTCEALWMGVPVITLAGHNYVSRMSTSVLSGANLEEWIAFTEQEYFEKALQAASQCQTLRESREKLRTHLQASPLGDAASLCRALGDVWPRMLQEVASY